MVPARKSCVGTGTAKRIFVRREGDSMAVWKHGCISSQTPSQPRRRRGWPRDTHVGLPCLTSFPRTKYTIISAMFVV
mgnify:CR=1 FL=1